MSLPQQLAGLLEPSAYPHECGPIELAETHISWVILTGPFAYKVKKPVRFAFVDFSTLERREHFCREELRCNRRFAPSLYVDVVPVGQGERGVAVGEADGLVEWAVKMRQFDPRAQLDRVLDRGELSAPMLEEFGRSLADSHRELPAADFPSAEFDGRVLAPMRDNYLDVEALDWTAPQRPALARGRIATEHQAQRLRGLLTRRFTGGWIRECHGDLHLSNLVALEQGVTAFDCLEFDPALRWIDPASDVAFLFMDCLVRDRADLAYAFLDGYLDAAGDYEGARLLALYAAYRSMVRAKVAALRRDQAQGPQADELERRFAHHVDWATAWLERPPGRLVLMCGVSGSGKSWLARRLVPRLPAIRLRSDVARKVLAGRELSQRVADEVDAGLYAAQVTRDTYAWLLHLAESLLRSGEHVLVDATFLRSEQRSPFAELAVRLGQRAVIVHCDAPRAVLEERVRARTAAGADPSDADPAVLRHQLARFEPPGPGDDAVVVDTRRYEDASALAALARELV